MSALLENGYEMLIAAIKPSEHPVLGLPSWEQVRGLHQQGGDAAIIEFFEHREKAIGLEQADPFNYGMVLEPWKDAERLLLDCLLLAVYGGNRASKTEYGAWRGVQVMAGKPGRNVLWLHESESTSVDVQQKAVWKYLPLQWKDAKRGQVTNLSYTQKNGFTDNKLVAPNGSMGKFGSYKQDVGDYEGLEFDLIVADEDLPLAWLRTLLVRLATRKGKFIWSYTPIGGITPAGKQLVEGAVTLQARKADPLLLDEKTRHVEDCEPGYMPYIQKSTYPDCYIIYFHSDLNPYSDYGALRKILAGFDVEGRKRRGYGYARNTLMTLFPTFSSAHIIEADKVPAKATRYHFADPAGARNMFQIWVAVDEAGRHFVYREWPGVDKFGEWAVPAEDNRRWDGAPGPGQPTLGYGVLEYKRAMLEAEGNRWDAGWVLCGEWIEQRYMDPRSGAAQSIVDSDGGTSLMDRMREEHYDDRGLLAGPSLDFMPAPGLREDDGIRVIQDLLSYDRRKPITAVLNEPKLFVVRSCENVIWALKNYTGHDGEKAACKDPIDCLRYMATSKLEYYDPARERSWGGGSY